MKSGLFFLVVILMIGFSSCLHGRMDTADEMPGTPSFSDTVVTNRDHPYDPEKLDAYEKTLPREYWR